MGPSLVLNWSLEEKKATIFSKQSKSLRRNTGEDSGKYARFWEITYSDNVLSPWAFLVVMLAWPYLYGSHNLLQNMHSLPKGYSWYHQYGVPPPHPLLIEVQLNIWQFGTNYLYPTIGQMLNQSFSDRTQGFRWSKQPPGAAAPFRRNPGGESETYIDFIPFFTSQKGKMCSVGQITCVVKAGRGPRPRRVKTETTQVSSIPSSSKTKSHGGPFK